MSLFDEIHGRIAQNGYHNHRRETHSDIISHRLISDLRATCPSFDKDCMFGVVRVWHKTRGPDGRVTDLLVGVPEDDGSPNLKEVRLLVENKSVITAHRNRNARQQDIDRERLSAHRANPRTIVVATLLVGTCLRVLNIPDCVARLNRNRFSTEILPRLSTGDQRLWQEFHMCVSENRPEDPRRTIELFRRIPVRRAADTHLAALDFLLIATMAIDNVNPPRLETSMGIDAEADYQKMLQHVCRLYNLRWYDAR